MCIMPYILCCQFLGKICIINIWYLSCHSLQYGICLSISLLSNLCILKIVKVKTKNRIIDDFTTSLSVFDNHDNKTGSRYAVIIYKRYQAHVAFIQKTLIIQEKSEFSYSKGSYIFCTISSWTILINFTWDNLLQM